jgi:sulfur-oxidizing protein SoxY
MKELSRREALLQGAIGSALAAIGLWPAGASAAAEGVDAAFAAANLADALRALGAQPADSAEVLLSTPDIAENGAVVQVGVQSSIPRTEEIHLLVEKNANPLVASFVIPAGTDSFVQLRVKMGQTTPVWALVKADGRWHAAHRETKVTLGGCGG